MAERIIYMEDECAPDAQTANSWLMERLGLTYNELFKYEKRNAVDTGDYFEHHITLRLCFYPEGSDVRIGEKDNG